MTGERILVVANPHGGRGVAGLDDGLDLLRDRGFRLDIHFPDDPCRIGPVLETRGPTADRIVVGGGDGTIHYNLPTLLSLNKPVGLLPLGTANDLARSLAIPWSLTDACRVIAEGTVARLDVARVNDIPFVNVASLGLGPEVTRRLDRRSKRRLGAFSYLIAAIGALRHGRPVKATMYLDDGPAESVHASHVAIGNGRFYGGALVVSQEATLADGLLDVVWLRVVPRWQLVLVAPFLRWGIHRFWEGAVHRRGRKVVLETKRRRSVTCDGELRTHTPCTIEVVPRALPVIVPHRGNIPALPERHG